MKSSGGVNWNNSSEERDRTDNGMQRRRDESVKGKGF